MIYVLPKKELIKEYDYFKNKEYKEIRTDVLKNLHLKS